MLKTLALAFALTAGTAAFVPALAFNPQPDRAGHRADYAQIKIPDDVVRGGDFIEFAAIAVPAVRGSRIRVADDWEARN
jgi:hypothetical protein